jgi:hypothetical protein
MAKFKRFDPENRKANQEKFKQRQYKDTRYDDYTKRKIEYETERQYDDDVIRVRKKTLF